MSQSEELYKLKTKIQQIKMKLNSKILAYILSKNYAPLLKQTRQYAKEMAGKMLKDANPILLQEIANYADDLQNFYCGNITVEYLLQEYVQEKQKEQKDERKRKSNEKTQAR